VVHRSALPCGTAVRYDRRHLSPLAVLPSSVKSALVVQFNFRRGVPFLPTPTACRRGLPASLPECAPAIAPAALAASCGRAFEASAHGGRAGRQPRRRHCRVRPARRCRRHQHALKREINQFAATAGLRGPALHRLCLACWLDADPPQAAASVASSGPARIGYRSAVAAVGRRRWPSHRRRAARPEPGGTDARGAYLVGGVGRQVAGTLELS
jgi:hypothetical protein